MSQSPIIGSFHLNRKSLDTDPARPAKTQSHLAKDGVESDPELTPQQQPLKRLRLVKHINIPTCQMKVSKQNFQTFFRKIFPN